MFCIKFPLFYLLLLKTVSVTVTKEKITGSSQDECTLSVLLFTSCGDEMGNVSYGK